MFKNNNKKNKNKKPLIAHSLQPHIACDHLDRSAGVEAPVHLCLSETLTVEGTTGDQQWQMPLTDPAAKVTLPIPAQLHKGGHYGYEAERSLSAMAGFISRLKLFQQMI